MVLSASLFNSTYKRIAFIRQFNIPAITLLPSTIPL